MIAWGLPPAPTKDTDSRSAHWDGLGQVELDAVKPEKLMQLLQNAIDDIFDKSLYEELMAREEHEGVMFKDELKLYISNL